MLPLLPLCSKLSLEMQTPILTSHSVKSEYVTISQRLWRPLTGRDPGDEGDGLEHGCQNRHVTKRHQKLIQ